MKTILAFCILTLSFSSIYSQVPDAGSNEEHTVVETMPKFQGDINKYLIENIRYPEDARENNIQGTVYVTFVVEKDGSVSNVHLLRGVEGGRSLENEAVRVVSSMPAWTPGSQDGKLVRVRYNIPIHFMLQDNTPPKKN